MFHKQTSKVPYSFSGFVDLCTFGVFLKRINSFKPVTDVSYFAFEFSSRNSLFLILVSTSKINHGYIVYCDDGSGGPLLPYKDFILSSPEHSFDKKSQLNFINANKATLSFSIHNITSRLVVVDYPFSLYGTLGVILNGDFIVFDNPLSKSDALYQ